MTPPLKWHGGKHYLAPKLWAIAKAVPHIHRVEPYFGGGAFTLASEPEGYSEVVNDINGPLANFWRVLQDPFDFEVFERKAQTTPFSERAWMDSGDENTIGSPIDAAFNFFVRCRQSMSGRMKGFAPLSRTRTRRGMNEQASAWMACVDGLPEVHARLRRVVILNQDALEVIKSQDGPQTLFYLDPPYLHETRVSTDEYAHEMTREQHKALLETLSKIQGKFMLSGYDNGLYQAFEDAWHWHRVMFDLPNNSASGEKKRRMTEVVWTNFKTGVTP